MFESGRFSLTSVKDFFAWLTAAVIFSLPWQTRWIFNSVPLGGQETPFGIFGIYAVEVLIILLGVTVIRVYKKTTIFSALQGPLLMFILGVAVSVRTSEWLSIAVFHAHMVFVAMLFFLLIALQGQYQKRFVVAFVAGLFVPILFGFMQVFGGYFPGSTVLGIAERMASRPGDSVLLVQGTRILRAYGSFPHPNIFGGYLSVAILFLFGLWSEWRTVGERWFFRVSCALLVLGLILTFSKSALLGLVVGLGMGLVVGVRSGVTIWRKWGSVITACVALIGTLVLILLPRLQPNALEMQSIVDRLAQWRVYPSVLMYQEDFLVKGLSLITGFGPGTYVFSWHASNMVNQVEQSWWLYQPIHNIFALLLAEIGLLGCVALLWFVFTIDRRNFEALPGSYARAALMAGASLFTIALFDHYLWTLWPGLILSAFVLGVTWGSGEVESNQKRG